MVPVLSAHADSRTLTLAAFDYERPARGRLPTATEVGQVLAVGRALKHVVIGLTGDLPGNPGQPRSTSRAATSSGQSSSL